MQQLNEYKYRIIEVIENAPDKNMALGSLMLTDNKHRITVKESLKFLEENNYLTKEEVRGFTYYSIKDTNKNFETIKVICPKCKTVREIYNPKQIVAVCNNSDCKTNAFFIRPRKTVYDMDNYINLYKE